MAADLSGPDLKTLWKDQEPEAEPMTLERIRFLVRRYDRRTRFTTGAMAAILLLTGLLAGQAWVKTNDLIMRLWAILFVFGEASVCVLVYRIVFPQRDPAEPAGAFLRRRLQIRLGYAQGRWLVAVSPLAPFMVLSVYVQVTTHRGPPWARLSTLVIFVAALIIGGLRSRARIPKLKAEIAELDELLRR